MIKRSFPKDKEEIKTQPSVEQNYPLQHDFLLDRDIVEIRAYQIFQHQGGNTLDNLVEAERILREEFRARHPDQDEQLSLLDDEEDE